MSGFWRSWGEDKEGLGSIAALLGQVGLRSGCQGHLPLAVWLGSGIFRNWHGVRGMRRAQGIFRTGRVWGSFVAAGPLLFPHTSSRRTHLIVFFTVTCCGCLLSPLQPSIFSQAYSFPLHWPLPTLFLLPDFGKGLGSQCHLFWLLKGDKGRYEER